MTAFVTLDGVSHSYGAKGGSACDTLAVDGLSISVEAGEFAAVVGPSGCGKSTLMKLATGLQFPFKGTIKVADEAVTRPVKIAGMAFQAPTLLPWRSTLDNLLLPLEILPAVLTAFLISFFPIVVNVATGLATIEPELEDVLKALGASKLDIMRKVGIPRTLPYFFGSLKIAITLAFVGSVISESIASNYGIGNLMLQAQAQFQVPLIFAGLIALAVEGIVMYALMAILEARMTGWAQRSGFAQA